MDNLENLDNKQLRAMCLEHGLPDVPITATSKKLLIRRLRVALEKKESEAGNQEKQQKIQEEIPEERTRERSKSRKSENVVVSSAITIPSGDVIGKVTVTQPQIQTQSRVTPDRRSEGFKANVETKSKRYSTGVTKNVQPRNMGKVTENFVLIEDDEDEFDFRPKKSVQSKYSLSASPVVTTTYVRDSVERIIDDEDHQVEKDVLEPRRFGIERKNLYNYDYETHKPYTSPLIEGLLNKPEGNMGLHHRQARSEIFSVNCLPKAATKTTASRLSEGYNNKEFDIVEKESPYLSEFTRKLSRLKAEPLDGGRTTEERLSYQRELSLKPRRKLDVRSTKQDSIGEYVKQLYLALDYKYGLRSKFFITLLILVLFCLYAFFF